MATKNVFEFVSGNLCVVSLRRMKIIPAKGLSAPFIVLSRNEIMDLLLAQISRIHTSRKDPKSRVALTAGIDATDLMKA